MTKQIYEISASSWFYYKEIKTITLLLFSSLPSWELS